jgi:hypothetical protein
MNMKAIARNATGFSLVQVLILSAVLSGLALVGTQLVVDSKKSQVGARSRDDLETLHASVVSALQDENNCTYALIENPPHLNPPPKIALPNNRDVVVVGTSYMNNQIRVEGISVNFPSTNSGTVTISYSRLNSQSGSSSRRGFGGQKIKKDIPLVVVTDLKGNRRCYVNKEQQNVELVKDFCENSLGGSLVDESFLKWDETSKECRIKEHSCYKQAGTVFVGISSTGKEICRDMNKVINGPGDIFDLNNPVCASRSNLKLAINANGKIFIDCSSTPSTPSCTPTNGNYTYSSWSTCTSGTQTRTVTSCSATCGGSCGTPFLSQPCSSCSPSPNCPSTYMGLPLQDFGLNQSSWIYGASTAAQRENGGLCLYYIRTSTSCDNHTFCDYTTTQKLGCSPTPTDSGPTCCPSTGQSVLDCTNNCPYDPGLSLCSPIERVCY